MGNWGAGKEGTECFHDRGGGRTEGNPKETFKGEEGKNSGGNLIKIFK